MKTGGAQAKGASFEREICVAFSLWMSAGERRDLYWRTAMSGGRATLAKKGGRMNKAQMGDICSVDTEGQWLIDNFLVECKFYRDLNIETGILNRRGLLYDFWRKLYRQSRDTDGRQPLLIARQNQTAILLITTERGTRLLGFYLPHPNHSLPAYHTHRIVTLHNWPAEPSMY